MSAFSKIKQRLSGEKSADEPVREPTRAGTGLPSRALPKLLGLLAVCFALYVAFAGGHKSGLDTTQTTATPAQTQANARPQTQSFASLIEGFTHSDDKHGDSDGSKDGHGGHRPGALPPVQPASSKSFVDGALPDPKNFKQQTATKQGNIAASNVLALTGPSGHHNANSTPPTAVPSRFAPPAPRPLGPVTQIPQGALPNARQTDTRSHTEKFLDKVAKDAGSGYGHTVTILPKLPGAVLYPGTVLPATTVTSVNTQLPGTVIAQTTSSVWGRNGRVAVPQGSRLVGQYDNKITNGQTRILIAFQRVIFPDGKELVLGNAKSVDASGASGNKADVDTHFAKMLGASLLISLLDTGVSYLGPDHTVTNGGGASFSGPTPEAAQRFGEVGKQILQPYISIQPTATIPSGTPINVLVNKTVVIPNGEHS